MQIYYDADCKICNNCKNFVLKFKKNNSKIIFLDMNNSQFKNEIKKTIVVENFGKEFRYSQAIKLIFKELIFPFNLFGYLPKFVIFPLYILLREIRKKIPKNTCKV